MESSRLGTAMAQTDDSQEVARLRRRIAMLEEDARVSRSSEALHRSVLDNAPDFICQVTPDGTFLFVNRLAPGLGVDDIVGMSMYDFVQPRFHANIRACLARVVETGQPDAYESMGVGAHGRTAHYFTRIGPIKDGDKVTALTVIATDVTRLKEAELALQQSEQRLRQSQKMEAIGQLAAGIAHNFNNMLAVILPNVELAQVKAGPGGSAPLETARAAAIRAAKLVDEMLLLAGRKTVSERRAEDARVIARRTIEMCRTMFDRQIAIELETTPDSQMISADAVQIEQALLNMLINARDALAGIEGRPLAIRVSVDRVAAGGSSASDLDGQAGVEVRIRVTDTGCGMDEATRLQIFEPFFTTKAPGQGTGLGLATTYAIVNDHGGRIDCTSTPGVGTTFSIYVAAHEGDRAESVRSVASETRGGSETVLIADDEALVRRGVGRILTEAGYSVLEAADGEAALALFRDQRGKIDLILMDQSMPKVSGRALLQALLALEPDTKVITFSGYGTRLEGARAALPKPTSMAVLLATVREVLDRE
jgi:two-component system, cell cycle sensor histidine kinase and response regulator CckA